MTILKVKQDYASAQKNYKKGQVIEVSPAAAEFLKRDAPGAFEEIDPTVKKAPDAPPADKAVKSPPAKKNTGQQKKRQPKINPD